MPVASWVASAIANAIAARRKSDTIEARTNVESVGMSDQTTNKKERRFTGSSSHGDLAEALRMAIGTAKETMETDFVSWRVESVTGEDGGFVLKTELTVTISASVAAPSTR